MKPHHVLIAVMILMTVAALYKFADNQRNEMDRMERTVAFVEKVKRYCPITWRTVLKDLDGKDCR